VPELEVRQLLRELPATRGGFTPNRNLWWVIVHAGTPHGPAPMHRIQLKY